MTNTVVDILLIEDNPHDAELTIRTLKKSRLTNNLLHLGDGQQALDFLFAENRKMPKLILLDLRMPKVDGWEVLIKLKSDEKTRLIPIIVMSSSKEDTAVLEAYKLGVACIMKPIDFFQFVTAIGKTGLFLLLIENLELIPKGILSWETTANPNIVAKIAT